MSSSITTRNLFAFLFVLLLAPSLAFGQFLSDSYAMFGSTALQGGTLGDTWSSNNVRIMFDEGAGTPPVLTVTFDFLGIPGGIGTIHLEGYYNGSAAHEVEARIWDWVGEAFVEMNGTVNDFPTRVDDDNYAFPIISNDWYSNGDLGGSVTFQIYHTPNGVTGHEFGIDYLYVDVILNTPTNTNTPTDTPTPTLTPTDTFTSTNTPTFTPTNISEITVEAIKDTHVRDYNATYQTYNWGVFNRVLIGYYSGFGFGHQRALVQFDLSGITPPISVLEARLGLYQDVGSSHVSSNQSHDVHVYRATAAWDEGTFNGTAGSVNWNDQPTFNTASLANETIMGCTPCGFKIWEGAGLLNAVEDWIMGDTTNYGFVVMNDETNESDDGAHKFYSREQLSFAPYLYIRYEILPTSTPTHTPTFSATPTASDTPTWTPTTTASITPTYTAIQTLTHTPTFTATKTPTGSRTPTFTRTYTATYTPSYTPTETPTGTLSPTSSNTPTAIGTTWYTNTNTPTKTPTNTLTNTPTRTPTWTPTYTPTTTISVTPSNTPTGTISPTATPTDTPTNSRTATPSYTAWPSNTPKDTKTPGSRKVLIQDGVDHRPAKSNDIATIPGSLIISASVESTTGTFKNMKIGQQYNMTHHNEGLTLAGDIHHGGSSRRYFEDSSEATDKFFEEWDHIGNSWSLWHEVGAVGNRVLSASCYDDLVTVHYDLAVDRNATVGNDLSVGNDATVEGNLFVGNTWILDATPSPNGNLLVEQSIYQGTDTIRYFDADTRFAEFWDTETSHLRMRDYGTQRFSFGMDNGSFIAYGPSTFDDDVTINGNLRINGIACCLQNLAIINNLTAEYTTTHRLKVGGLYSHQAPDDGIMVDGSIVHSQDNIRYFEFSNGADTEFTEHWDATNDILYFMTTSVGSARLGFDFDQYYDIGILSDWLDISPINDTISRGSYLVVGSNVARTTGMVGPGGIFMKDKYDPANIAGMSLYDSCLYLDAYGAGLRFNLTPATADEYALRLNYWAKGDVQLFGNAHEGETPSLSISGYRNGDQLRTMAYGVSPTRDNTFLFSGMGTYEFDRGIILGNDASMVNGSMYYNGADVFAYVGGSPHSITQATSGDSDWVIIGSNQYSGVSGNVGIGTSSPSAKLEVIGSVYGTAADFGLVKSTATPVAGRINVDAIYVDGVGGVPTFVPIDTFTPTFTSTSTMTITDTPTNTPTQTPTDSPTDTPTATPT